MSITGELVRISTATMAALPVNLTDLSTHLSATAWPTTELGCHFFFTKRCEQWLDRPHGGLFQFFLDPLAYRFALFTLYFPAPTLYPHPLSSSSFSHLL